MSQAEVFQKLAAAVVAMEEVETIQISQLIVEQGIDAYQAIEQGLAAGMERAGQLFEEGEYFIPELLMCSDAMYAGLDVLKPHLKSVGSSEKSKIIIGVVEGDTHDIGKNIVKIMLETSGYEVIDLGRDVQPRDFVTRAKLEGAAIIAAATLMTTTLDGMQEIMRILELDQVRNQFKVMIGGGPVSQAYADKIGADAYAVNATDAVRKAKWLLAKEASYV
jgi:corrinoid protein of di/trimethylamine methyltransferase